jgi:hypothetical protein
MTQTEARRRSHRASFIGENISVSRKNSNISTNPNNYKGRRRSTFTNVGLAPNFNKRGSSSGVSLSEKIG